MDQGISENNENWDTMKTKDNSKVSYILTSLNIAHISVQSVYVECSK